MTEWKGLVIGGTPGAGKSSAAEGVKEILEEYADPVTFPAGEHFRKLYSQSNYDGPFHEWYKEHMEDPEKNLEFNRRLDNFVSGRIEDGFFPVVESRYVHYFQPNVLRAYFDADVNVRAERAKTAKNSDGELRYPDAGVEEIAEILLEREQDEVDIGKRSWGENFDHRNPRFYQLLFDTETQSIKEEIDMIWKTLQGNLSVPPTTVRRF